MNWKRVLINEYFIIDWIVLKGSLIKNISVNIEIYDSYRDI